MNADQRRSGAGRALLDAVAVAAFELGCDEVVVESSSWRTQARAFYRAMGFVEQTMAFRFRRKVPR